MPRCEFQGGRRSIENYVRDRNRAELRAYLPENNAQSLDGLPGMEFPKYQ